MGDRDKTGPRSSLPRTLTCSPGRREGVGWEPQDSFSSSYWIQDQGLGEQRHNPTTWTAWTHAGERSARRTGRARQQLSQWCSERGRRLTPGSRPEDKE